MRTRATARRRWLIVAVVLLPVGLGACGHSGAAKSSKTSKSAKSSACTSVAKLDEIADAVAHADVSDPDTFNKTLQTAVTEYVANVRTLETVVPSDLRASLGRVEADVQEFRFDAARTDRHDLDAYAATNCGRVGTTVAAATTSVPTTVAGSGTDTSSTVATGTTTSNTAASDG